MGNDRGASTRLLVRTERAIFAIRGGLRPVEPRKAPARTHCVRLLREPLGTWCTPKAIRADAPRGLRVACWNEGDPHESTPSHRPPLPQRGHRGRGCSRNRQAGRRECQPDLRRTVCGPVISARWKGKRIPLLSVLRSPGLPMVHCTYAVRAGRPTPPAAPIALTPHAFRAAETFPSQPACPEKPVHNYILGQCVSRPAHDTCLS